MRRLAIAVGLVGLTACGSKNESPSPALRAAAGDIARDIARAVEASEEVAVPFPCATLDAPSASEVELGEVGERKATRLGQTVRFTGKRGDQSLAVGLIADARGTAPETIASLGRLRAQLSDAGAEIIVLLGGMGQHEDELVTHIQLLIQDATWPVLVVPGDREEIPALRKAITRVGGDGGQVLDGSRVRFVVMDGAVLATLPGVASPERLFSRSLGCVYERADIDELASRLGAFEETRVWLSYSPPRSSAPSGSDVAIGGVHIGDQEQTAAIASARAQLVLHAALDEAAIGADKGSERLDSGGPVVLGVGSADPLPVTDDQGNTVRSVVTIAHIEPHQVRWRRLTGP